MSQVHKIQVEIVRECKQCKCCRTYALESDRVEVRVEWWDEKRLGQTRMKSAKGHSPEHTIHPKRSTVHFDPRMDRFSVMTLGGYPIQGVSAPTQTLGTCINPESTHHLHVFEVEHTACNLFA